MRYLHDICRTSAMVPEEQKDSFWLTVSCQFHANSTIAPMEKWCFSAIINSGDYDLNKIGPVNNMETYESLRNIIAIEREKRYRDTDEVHLLSHLPTTLEALSFSMEENVMTDEEHQPGLYVMMVPITKWIAVYGDDRRYMSPFIIRLSKVDLVKLESTPEKEYARALQGGTMCSGEITGTKVEAAFNSETRDIGISLTSTVKMRCNFNTAMADLGDSVFILELEGVPRNVSLEEERDVRNTVGGKRINAAPRKVPTAWNLLALGSKKQLMSDDLFWARNLIHRNATLRNTMPDYPFSTTMMRLESREEYLRELGNYTKRNVTSANAYCVNG
jgi:hypothetical protein